MIFTRYLYIKEEVEKALLISLLKQNKEQSLFWFNELVESGFDLEEMCEELYFDIYFTNNHNPSFLLSSSFTSIVENLIITDAKCNLDIYILRTAKRNELDIFNEDTQYEDFSIWLKERNYKKIANYLLYDCDEIILPYIYKLISKHTLQSICKNKRIYYLGIILSREIISSPVSSSPSPSKSNIKLQIKEYVKPWQILATECKYSIDEYKYLGLFELERHTMSHEELINRYHNHWLYYASFSLLWKNRIEKYNGIICHQTKQVIFNKEEEDSDFYNLFNLEPDEQKREIQDKNIGIIQYDKTTDKVINFYNELLILA